LAYILGNRNSLDGQLPVRRAPRKDYSVPLIVATLLVANISHLEFACENMVMIAAFHDCHCTALARGGVKAFYNMGQCQGRAGCEWSNGSAAHQPTLAWCNGVLGQNKAAMQEIDGDKCHGG
jgi:hypothetical protein